MKLFVSRIFFVVLLGIVFVSVRSWTSEGNSIDSESLVDALVDTGLFSNELSKDSLNLSERIIVVTSNVNAHFSKTIITQLLLLNKRSTSEPIDLYLRTEGGWIADAFAVIDTLRSIEAPVNIHALGEVHSAGIMILAAGTGKRIVYPYTILGFHAMDKSEDEIFNKRLDGFWRDVATLPDEWLARTYDSFFYFTPEEAVKYNIADFIAGSGN